MLGKFDTLVWEGKEGGREEGREGGRDEDRRPAESRRGEKELLI